MDLWVGLGGVTRNACAAVGTDDKFLGICEQERITRVKGAGFNATGLPDEALDAVLEGADRNRRDVAAFALAEPLPTPPQARLVRLDHHFAHACSAFFASPFETASIVVCDHERPEVSVWDGNGNEITAVEWPWHGPGFASVYSLCADALGFTAALQEQRMEALARFEADGRDQRARDLFWLGDEGLGFLPDWQARIGNWLGTGTEFSDLSRVAAALQTHLGDLLAEFLIELRRRKPERSHLCVGGSLFYNSYFNTRVKLSDAFDACFVPINPGNAGLAVGAALKVSGNVRRTISPFLGPSYDPVQIKETLDNCKLQYVWGSESDVIGMALETLRNGQLLAWFEGPMEWGPRALGGRSIVANPFAPYVLENLNRFLKHRPLWRGYALSGSTTSVHQHFIGPRESPFMECDYIPKDRELFRHILPGPNASVRIHTAETQAPPRFRELLHAFGQTSGIPILANTSFNGFHEPIVCTPRDAVRVFFGSGIDTLVLDRFIVSK